MTDIYEHHDWARVEALIKTWPAATRIAPDALAGYMAALIYPNGRDRAARTDDPVALERVILELIQEDTQGKRPPIGAVVERLALHRQAQRAQLDRGERDREPDGGPAPDWVLAHALALSSPDLPLVLAAARRFDRPLTPAHEPGDCPTCWVSQRMADTKAELARVHGAAWKHNGDALQVWAEAQDVIQHEFEAIAAAKTARERAQRKD